MKFIFPIKSHDGIKPTITQGFGEVSNVAWYKANNLNIPFHNGVDIVLNDNINTYGSEIICPFLLGRVTKIWWDTPMNTKGNGVLVESCAIIENGKAKKYEMLVWHCSQIIISSGEVKEGDVIALVGNSGLVLPAPTPDCPLCGSHAHIMFYEYTFDEVEKYWKKEYQGNGVQGAQDPMKYLDINRIIKGKDTGAGKDAPPFKWAIEKLGLNDVLSKIKYVYNKYK